MLAVVSGAARGLGLSFCQALTERGHDVIAACRTSTRELEALGVEVVDGVDLTSDACTTRLSGAVGERPVDLALSNAGFYSGATDDFDYEAIRLEYEVNTLGSMRFVSALLPSLREGSKIAFLSSRGGSIGGALGPGNYGYRMAKAALNLFAVGLSLDVREHGVAVLVLHPGYLDTDMSKTGRATGRAPAGTPRPPLDAARDLLDRIDELTLETSGRWVDSAGEPIPW
jgi:NAD(P)-dependent dehydrogenase (short-subunit alcohol dehydrogenase family)